jgi:O-antigen/teichoic acid export membrane protein
MVAWPRAPVTTEGGLARKSLSIARRDSFLALSNLAAGVVVARMLGPTALGVWAIFLLIISYAEALGRPKFDQAAVYFIAARKYDPGMVAFALHAVAIASSAVLIAAAALWFDPWYDLLFGSAPDIRSLIWLVLLQIPLQFLYLNYAYLHISRQDITAYNRMVILRALANSGLSIAALVVLQLGLAGVVWAMLTSTAAAIVYGARLFHRQIRILPKWDWALVRDFGGYSANLYVAGAVGQLNNQLTNLLCAVYLVPAQLAIFSIAAARRDIISILPNAVGTLLFPRVSAIPERAEAARLTAKTARILFLVMVAVGFAAAIAVGPVVLVLYGPEYLPVAEPFRLLLPGFVLYGATSPYLNYFLGTGRSDLTVKVAIPAVMLQLVLALLLIPRWGLGGAAVALLAPLVLGSIIALVVFVRLTNLTLAETIFVQRGDIALLFKVAKREIVRYWPGEHKIPSSAT